MHFKEITNTVQQLTDEELATMRAQAAEEYRRRIAESFEKRRVPGPVTVVIDLAPLVESIRESIREEMVFASDAVFSAILEKVEGQPILTEEQLTALFRSCLSIAYGYEAQCEVQRRLDLVE